MNLELIHLATYLPYGLSARLSHIGVFNLDYEQPTGSEYKPGIIKEFSTYGKGFNGTIKVSDRLSYDFEELEEIEIILKPLDSFINYNIPLHPDDKLEILEAIADDTILQIRHDLFILLVQNKFDVFHLIDSGLALDYNTVNI